MFRHNLFHILNDSAENFEIHFWLQNCTHETIYGSFGRQTIGPGSVYGPIYWKICMYTLKYVNVVKA